VCACVCARACMHVCEEHTPSVCVFERGRVCDVMSSGCVTTRKTVVRLVTAGWKQCVWVCDVDTGAVDLWRWAT